MNSTPTPGLCLTGVPDWGVAVQKLRTTVDGVADRHGRALIIFPNELDVVVTRDFVAPINLVFDVFTKVEHVRKTFAPIGEEMTVCEIDLRVGGNYHFVMVTDDGVNCSFRGTYVEIDPPFRTVETWMFEGWTGVEAVESMDLRSSNGRTTLTWQLAFADKVGREHMTKFDGIEANFDIVEDYLRSLLDVGGTTSG